jgi:hypothetical protein
MTSYVGPAAPIRRRAGPPIPHAESAFVVAVTALPGDWCSAEATGSRGQRQPGRAPNSGDPMFGGAGLPAIGDACYRFAPAGSDCIDPVSWAIERRPSGYRWGILETSGRGDVQGGLRRWRG